MGADEDQCLSQQRGKRPEPPCEVLDVRGHLLGGWYRLGGDLLLQSDFLPPPGPQVLVEDISEDGEAPGPEFGNFRDVVYRLQRSGQSLLHEIVGFGFRSRQEARESPQIRQQIRECGTQCRIRALPLHPVTNINEIGVPRAWASRNMGEKVMSGSDRTALLRALPYARRYARALLGSQEQGDVVVAAALRAALADITPGVSDAGARAALYLAISDDVRRASSDTASAAGGEMSLLQRMLLLLTALEEQPLAAAAAACRLEVEVAERELRAARDGLRANAAARVLIIEDEPIIALDIQDLVERCGHSVVGIASTETEAVRIARAERPSLVLADINLGAGGDGATAVARILRDVTAPVIFVTAFPERLLTGAAVEPAFVITKPFDPTTLAVATYQAVTRGVRPV